MSIDRAEWRTRRNLAISRASALETLRLVHASNVRLRLPYVSIEDDGGVIELHRTLEAARNRVASVSMFNAPEPTGRPRSHPASAVSAFLVEVFLG